MPHISLYVNTETLKKIEIAAELNNTSISKWVTDSFCAETIKDFSPDAERETL